MLGSTGTLISRFVLLSSDSEGAAPSPRLTYLVDRYLRAPFRIFVDAIRSGQQAGLIDPAIRGDLLLFFFLGAAATSST